MTRGPLTFTAVEFHAALSAWDVRGTRLHVHVARYFVARWSQTAAWGFA